MEGLTEKLREIEKLLVEKYKVAAAALASRDIERILDGEPLDYIIGWVPFLGCHIDLSLRPFIPRPETEFWVSEVIKTLKKKKGHFRVLDMFAGSGCIGIAALKHVPEANVTFAEKNPRFVEQIKINLLKNRVSQKKFNIVRSNIFSKVNGRFTVILANPPYVGKKDYISKEVKQFEPREAWFGGKHGLTAIGKFLKSAKRHVAAKGEIWMEFGHRQRGSVESLLRQLGYSNFSFHEDQYGRMRYVVVIM